MSHCCCFPQCHSSVRFSCSPNCLTLSHSFILACFWFQSNQVHFSYGFSIFHCSQFRLVPHMEVSFVHSPSLILLYHTWIPLLQFGLVFVSSTCVLFFIVRADFGLIRIFYSQFWIFDPMQEKFLSIHARDSISYRLLQFWYSFPLKHHSRRGTCGCKTLSCKTLWWQDLKSVLLIVLKLVIVIISQHLGHCQSIPVTKLSSVILNQFSPVWCYHHHPNLTVQLVSVHYISCSIVLPQYGHGLPRMTVIGQPSIKLCLVLLTNSGPWYFVGAQPWKSITLVVSCFLLCSLVLLWWHNCPIQPCSSPPTIMI